MNHDALGDDKRVRWRSIAGVHTVKFESGRTAAHVAGIAEHRALAHAEPRPHERGARIVDSGNEAIGKAEMAALTGKADADQLVARPPIRRHSPP